MLDYVEIALLQFGAIFVLHPPSDLTLTLNKMHSRRGHTSTQLCFQHVSVAQTPSGSSLYVSLLLLHSFLSFSAFLFLSFAIASFILTSFVFNPPSLPSCILSVEVNHHLYYSALQLINNVLGRKKNNPHLLSSSLSLSSFSYTLFPLFH